MEEIEKEMSVNGQSVDAFSVVVGPEHPGRLRLYRLGITKASLKKKLAILHQLQMKQMMWYNKLQERMQKMEKEIEEQRRTMRQEVIADVVAQLQRAGLIDPSILATLSVPSLAEATPRQVVDQD